MTCLSLLGNFSCGLYFLWCQHVFLIPVFFFESRRTLRYQILSYLLIFFDHNVLSFRELIKSQNFVFRGLSIVHVQHLCAALCSQCPPMALCIVCVSLGNVLYCLPIICLLSFETLFTHYELVVQVTPFRGICSSNQLKVSDRSNEHANWLIYMTDWPIILAVRF